MDGVLVIESDKELLDSLVEIICIGPYRVSAALNTDWAFEELKSGRAFSAILLGHHLPHLDGIEFLRRIKSDSALNDIPVIFHSKSNDQEVIYEGISSGANSYIPKPVDPSILLALTHSVVKQHHELVAMKRVAQEKIKTSSFLHSGVYQCRDIAEASELANGLAHMCPDHERMRLVFHELLINGVEHGNLEIGYTTKTRLILEDSLREEIELRLSDPHYSNRQVMVDFIRSKDRLTFIIKDEGEGFDWRSYMELNPERAMDPNGRGIALAIMASCECVKYLGSGNTVEVTVDLFSSPST